MECTVIEVKTMLCSEDVQYYFKVVGTNQLLYWVTGSEKAWDELPKAKMNHKIVLITSFKEDGTFKNADGEMVQSIKNVRFKVM